MTEPNRYRAETVQVRLLYPFLYEPDNVHDELARLRKLEWKGRSVWDGEAAPPPLYRAELKDEVWAHLFGQGPGRGSYLRVHDAVAGAWLRRNTSVVFASAVEARIGWVAGLWIELFLSPDGVGILSLALEPHWTNAEAGEAGLARIKSFIYRIAQARNGTTPDIVTPHPQDDPSLAWRLGPDTPPPPAPDAAIEDRLGAPGASVTLPEVCGFVVSPLKTAFGLLPFRSQFAVYTVIRLDESCDFQAIAPDHYLMSTLRGMAAVEEAGHAGTSASVLESAVLNPKHFVAVTSLGLVHAVADQSSAGASFNPQRVPTARDKYFPPFLFAYQQLLALNSYRHKAAGLVSRLLHSRGPREPEEVAGGFAKLRTRLLAFAVGGHASEASTRHVINYYYALAQRGLGVREALETVRRAIQDAALDQSARAAAEESHKQGESLALMVSTQNKLEWIEIFIVSYYATELARTIAELNDFTPGYMAITIPLWTAVVGAIAILVLRPWKHHKERAGGGKRWLWILLIPVLAGLWWSKAPRVKPPAPGAEYCSLRPERTASLWNAAPGTAVAARQQADSTEPRASASGI